MWILLLWMGIIRLTSGLPSMRDSLTNPVHVYEGDDALITCVVRDIGENTIMWKKEDRERHSRRVLTAGDTRVTADKRFAVLHETSAALSDESPDVSPGGDVWVLVIKNAMPTDSGIYVCEVNSNPIVRSFHKVSVLSKALQPPANNATSSDVHDESAAGATVNQYSEEEDDEMNEKESFSSKKHNYTDCCVARNVSSNCLGFCNIQSILEGSTGQDPENCENDFPAIVRCMADGRNHVPCCIQERVPDICQDVCRGEYTAITDNIKTHFSCSSYTEQTLACIVEGIELLPSPPEDVEVDVLSENLLNVSWSPPRSNLRSITGYTINVTMLRSFDARLLKEATDEITATTKTAGGDSGSELLSSVAPPPPHSIQIKLAATKTSAIVNAIKPFTMYEVSVTAVNVHGSSLPSYTVRTLTLTPGQMKQPTIMNGEAPVLPDIRSCCAARGVAHKTCVNKLCDPAMANTAEISDLMICAPWASDTFSCLANGLDHTPCCKARGLPELCQQLCTGNVSTIDFNYFKCLRYMGEYTNCLLQGYGVLPSAPQHVHITNIETDFVILHWSPPKTLSDTVTQYNVHYRMFGGGGGDSEENSENGGDVNDEPEYKLIAKVRNSPFILEHLDSNTDYEIYIEAVNAHGTGMPSNRLTFRTESKIVEERIEEASYYNVTACCVDAELSNVCLPLCSYNANMTDIKLLAGVCGAEFHKLLRCGAGGRNHGTCCTRRGVPPACLSLCSGVIVDSLLVTATTCVPYIGNIAQCFEEGTGVLPGPISELHATVVDSHTIFIEWESPTDGANNVTDFVVHYQKVDNTSMHETLLKLDNQLNITGTSATITGLETGGMYHIFVVSRNEYGTSLPSSIIVINLVKSDGHWVKAVTSPPHSLAVAAHSATWVTISWQPPEFSHPSEQITYRLHYKSAAGGEETFHIINITVTSYMMVGLSPNTQYIVYVTALNDKGPSMPSETLIAWTDPAYPAFVEPPTVHPINLVIEGSSMTVLCIAMGTPMPTISLYISGRLVRQETTRHMVTVIHNVTKDMDQISCYADNGYGTPMQASRKIIISHGPHIQASGITMATLGDSVTLECKVTAQPEPKMIFWRNHETRTPVIQGGKYDIRAVALKDEPDKYLMHLTIKQITNVDAGEYYCHAENAFGSATQPVSVRMRNIPATSNITQCCIEQNVTATCMSSACSFYGSLDMDSVIDQPECLNDFDKLMKCAADGSDHRSCCAQWGVPRRCLDWCRGEPILNMHKICVLSYTKQIMSCFHEGREKLPGPPQNVRIEFLDAHSVNIVWDPPVKNPHTVELYRVFWRPIDESPEGKKSSPSSGQKGDTSDTHLKIGELKDGATYECVVKAGNSRGTSTLTEPIKFTMGEKYITSAASHSEEVSHVGVAVAVVLALVVVAAIVVGAVWFMRTKKMLGVKSSSNGGVAFENPSYLREVNMDHIQIPQSENPPSSVVVPINGTIPISNNNNSSSIAAVSSTLTSFGGGGGGVQGWNSEALHVPTTTQQQQQQAEVNPTLYEELKLGQDGVGFKRLKP